MASSVPTKPAPHTKNASLKLELEELDDSEMHFPEPVESLMKKTLPFYDLRKSMSVDLMKSFKMTPRTLGVHKQDDWQVFGKAPRKSPCEEYFFLATQAMKLNSVYIDTICTVSPKSLYQTAVKNQIPFHKWHTWIEQQLNASYLTSIYKKISGR
jgi:hypothetical protein